MHQNAGFIADNIPHPLMDQARSLIDRALAPFAGRFDTVKASLAGEKDNSGGVACEVRLRLVPSGIWIIQESRAATAYHAIENAVDAIARSLRRQLGRLSARQPLTTAA